MPVASVIPSVPVTRRRAEPPPRSIAYELREAHALPTIDCSLCIKHVVLSKRWLLWCNYVLHRYGRAVAVAYALGCCGGWTFWAVDATTGEWLAVFAMVMQALPLLTTLLLLRYDMVVLLLGSYEFWYLTACNLVASAFVCAMFADLRMLASIAGLAAYELVMLMDANYRGAQGAVLFTAVSTLDIIAFVVFTGLHLHDRARNMELFTYNGWSVEATDVIVNGFSTIILLLVRNAYRKHRAIKRHDLRVTTVRCITYYCRTQFVRVRAQAMYAKRTSIEVASTTIHGDEPVSALSELKFVPFGRVFDASDVLARRFLGDAIALEVKGAGARVMPAVAVAGLALTVAAFACISSNDERVLEAVGITAVVTTATYCVVCVAHFQCGIVRLLLASFDLWFLGLQLTLAHVALAHLFHWHLARILPLICSWLWSHWVLMLDALTPILKTKLGVSMRLAAVVVVLLLVGQVLLCVEIVVLANWGISDIVITTVTVAGKQTKFRVAPILFTRVFTVLAWCGRLLWRLWTRGEDGLVMVLGSVEYEDMELRRRLRSSALTKRATRSMAAPSLHAIHPTTATGTATRS